MEQKIDKTSKWAQKSGPVCIEIWKDGGHPKLYQHNVCYPLCLSSFPTPLHTQSPQFLQASSFLTGFMYLEPFLDSVGPNLF